MRDSIPPFLGLFLGCPVVRSLSWCGRRKKEGQEGRTDIRQLICGNPWQWSHPLIHSLCFSNHSLLRKTLKSIFSDCALSNWSFSCWRLRWAKQYSSNHLSSQKQRHLSYYDIPLSYLWIAIVLRTMFLPSQALLYRPPLIARWSQTMAATQRFQSTLDEARWKN